MTPTCQLAGLHPRPLTPKQRAIVRFAERYHRVAGEWPRAVHISDKFGFTHEGARQHIAALERKGWAVRDTSPLILRGFLIPRR